MPDNTYDGNIKNPDNYITPDNDPHSQKKDKTDEVTYTPVDDFGMGLINKDREEQQKLQGQGFKTLNYEKGFNLLNYDPNFNRKMYSHFLGDKNGNYIYGTANQLNKASANSQSELEGFFSVVNPMLFAKIGNRIIGDVGRIGATINALNGDFTFENELTQFEQKNNEWFRNTGNASLSNYQDKQVGDFKGFMEFTDQLLISWGSIALETLLGGAIMKGGLNALKAAGIGIKMMNAATKVGTFATSFTLTLSESAMQATEAYTQTIANYMKMINPATGLYYTADEVKDKAKDASKIAFGTNQVIGTVLNMVGLEARLVPELSAERLIEKELLKKEVTNIEKNTFGNIAKDLQEAKNISITSAKKVAGSNFGWKKLLAVGVSEGFEEQLNNYATAVGVNYAMNGGDLINAYTNTDTFKDVFTSRDGFWTFMSGFLGGAGNQAFMGYAPINVSALFQNEFIERESKKSSLKDRAVYTMKNTPAEYLELNNNIKDELLKEKKIISRPKKPFAFENKEAEQKYKSDLKKFNKIKRQNVFTNQYRLTKQAYLDAFEQKAKLMADVYREFQLNINDVNTQLDNKSKGIAYSDAKINSAREKLFNTNLYFHIMNGSSKTLKNTFNSFSNLNAEKAKELGLIDDLNDKSYITKSKKSIKDIEDAEKEYDKINKTFGNKNKNIFDTLVPNAIFLAYTHNKNIKDSYNSINDTVNKKLQERQITQQDADLIFHTFMNSGIKIKSATSDKEVTPYEYLVSEVLPEGLMKARQDSSQIFGKLLLEKLLNSLNPYKKYKTKKELTEEENNNPIVKELFKSLNAKDENYISFLFDLISQKAADIALNASSSSYNDIQTNEKIEEMNKSYTRSITKYIQKVISENEQTTIKEEAFINTKKDKEDEKDIANKAAKLQQIEKQTEVSINVIEDKIEEISKTSILNSIPGSNDLYKSHLENKNQFQNIIDKITDISIKNGLQITLNDYANAIDIIIKTDNIYEFNNALKSLSDLVNKLNKDLTNIKNNVNVVTQSIIKSDEKLNDVLSKETYNEMEDILQSFNNTATIIPDDNTEYDNAINYNLSDEDKMKLNFKFTSALNKIYIEWINKVKITNNNKYDYKHYIEFYKFMIVSFGEKFNPEMIKDLYEDNAMRFLKDNGIVSTKASDIISRIADMDFLGNLPENINNITPTIEDITSWDEDKTVSNEQIEDITDLIYTGNKNTSPSNSVAYNEREALKVDMNGKLNYIENNNITQISIQEKMKIGDTIILEVLNDDDIEITLENDSKAKWGDLKNNIDKNKFIPIVIKNNNGDIIGMLHDETWIKKHKSHIAETVNVEQEISNLNNIRNYIVNANSQVTTSIENMTNGVLNKDFNKTLNSINNNMPNFQKADVKIGIFDGTQIYTDEITTLENNVINIKNLRENGLKGAIIMLVPNANKTKYIPELLKRSKLGDNNKFLSNVIVDLIKEFIENPTSKVSSYYLNKLQSLTSSFLYLKHFEFSDLDKGDVLNKRFFFNITKDGNIEFAHTHSDNTIFIEPFTIFKINLSDPTKYGLIQVIKRDTTTGEVLQPVTVDRDNYEDIFKLLSNILSEKVVNFNIKFNNNKEFTLPIKKDGVFQKAVFPNYVSFISNFLNTNVIEKSGKDDNDNDIFSYVLQPVLTLKTDFLKNEIKQKPSNQEEINNKFIKDKLENNIKPIDKNIKDIIHKRSENKKLNNNEEFEDEEFENAISYSDESLNELRNNTVNNNTKLDYEVETALIKNIIYDINDNIENKILVNDDDINNHFNELIKNYNDDISVYNVILNNYDENTWDNLRKTDEIKTMYEEYSNLTYKEIQFKNNIYNVVINNSNNIKKEVLEYLNENVNDIEDEDENNENEELNRKPDWDLHANEKNTELKSSLRLKILFNSIPIARFKVDENYKFIIKDGERVIIYKKDILGNKERNDSRIIRQKVISILTDLIHVGPEFKFKEFINALKNADDAELLLLANKLENADDNTKASFINTSSVQDTNSKLFLFKTNHTEQGLSNVVIVKTVSDQAEINNIIEFFKQNAVSNFKDNSFLIKKDNKIVLNRKKLEDYMIKIATKTFTTDDLFYLLNGLGLEFTKSEFNKTFINDTYVKRLFSKKGVNSSKQLLLPNYIIDYMIHNILDNDTQIDVNIVNPLEWIDRDILRKFAMMKLTGVNRFGSTTYKNGEGNTVQSVMYNSMLSKTLAEVKDKNSDLFKQLSSNDSTMTGISKSGKHYRSFWIKYLNDNINPNMYNGIFDSLEKWSKYSNPKTKPNMNFNELLVQMMFGFINNNKKDVFLFSPLTYSDKKTPGLISVPRYNINFENFIFNKTILNPALLTKNGFINLKADSSIIQDVYNYFVFPEVSRINKHINAIYNKDIDIDTIPKNELYGGYLFYFAPQLNGMTSIPRNGDVNDLIPFRDELGRILTDNKEVLKALTIYTIDTIQKDIENIYNLFNDIFIQKRNKNTRFDLLDDYFINKYKKLFDEEGDKNNITNDMILKLITTDFVFNFRLATVEYTKILGSNFSSTYKAKGDDKFNQDSIINKDDFDNNKLIDGKISFLELTENNGEHLINKTKQAIDEYLKRMAKDIAPQIDGYWQDNKGRDFSKFIQLYITEPKTSFYDEIYKNLNVFGYNGVEGADAQEYSTFKEYIIMAHAYKNIDNELYTKIMNGIEEVEKRNKEIILKMENENAPIEDILKALDFYKIPEDVKKILNVTSTKPVFSGHVYNEKLGRKISKYIKVSTFPLVAEITNNSELNMLRRRAEYLEAKTGLSVRIAMGSGVKEGAINIRNIWNVNEKDKSLTANIKIINELNGETLSRKNLGIQLEEPMNEVKSRINVVTQANKLIFAGLLTGYDSSDESMAGFIWNGKKLTALQLKKIKENIIKNLSNKSSSKLLKSVGLKYVDGNLILINPEDKNKFIIKLQNLIKDEMNARSSNFTQMDKDMIALINNNDFKFPLDFIGKSNKIQSLLLSIITNRILKLKMPGKNYINTAGNGIMTFNGNSEIMSDIIFTENYNNKRLNFIDITENGTQYAQCFIPFNFTDTIGKIIDINKFIIEKNGKKYLDTSANKFDKELLKLIGLRIPNQAHSSMLLLEIAGFLPEYMKNVIILPPEITKQMGSDNDNDHLYTYSFNTNTSLIRDKNDSLIKEIKQKYTYNEYVGDKEYESLKKQYEDLAVKYSENNINSIKNLLTDEEKIVFDKIIKNDELHNFDKIKISSITNEIEKSIKNKMNDFYKVWYETYITNEEKISALKGILKTTRETDMRKSIKSNIKEIMIEKEGLQKLNYNKDDIESNDENQLQNAYIDIFHTVLSNPEVSKKMINVLDLPYLADESKLLKEIDNKNKRFDPLSPTYAIEMYLTNQDGKVGVAAQSSVSTFIALIEDKNLKFNEKIVNYTPIKFEDEHNKIHLITGIGVAKSNFVLKNKITPLDNIAINQMLQSEAVDNAKNLNLSSIAYNRITAIMYNALLLMKDENNNGIPAQILTRLMKQEVITEFVKAFSNKQSVISDFNLDKPKDIFINLFNYFNSEYKNITKENIEVNEKFILKNPENLLKLINDNINNTKDKDYYKYQALLANWLSNVYNTYFTPLNNMIISISGIDSKSIGKSLINTKIRYKKVLSALVDANLISNVDNISYNNDDYTETKIIFNNTLKLAQDLYLNQNITNKMLFGQDSVIFNRIANKLDNDYKVSLDFVDNQELIWKTFLQYIFNNSLSQALNINEQDERKRLLYGNSSLAIRTLQYKNENWFTNNKFLVQLKVDLNNNLVTNTETGLIVSDNKAMFVKYSSYLKDNSKDYNIINDFLKLFYDLNNEFKNNPNDEQLRNKVEYIEDIVKYTILEGGIQNSHNWIKFIHPTILEEMGILSKLRSYQNNINESDIDKITSQIIKNNPSLMFNFNKPLIDVENVLTVQNENENSKRPQYLIVNKNTILESKDYSILNQLLIFKTYNKELKEHLMFEQNANLETEDMIVFNRIDKLGTTNLGITEIGPNVTTSIIKEEKTINSINNSAIIDMNIYTSTKNTIADDFANNPTYDTVVKILTELSLDSDITANIAKVILSFPELYKDVLFINQSITDRARTVYDKNTGKALKIIINMNRLQTLHKDNNEELINEFKELLLHEMLHPIFKNLSFKIKNNTATTEEIEIYNNLENLRKELTIKMEEKYQGEHEEYNKQKKEVEDKLRDNIDKNLVMHWTWLDNVAEMLSYGWTNKEVQKEMKEIELLDGKTGIQKFTQYIKDIIDNLMKQLGIKDNTGLSSFIKTSMNMYNIEENLIKEKEMENNQKDIKDKTLINDYEISKKKKEYIIKTNKNNHSVIGYPIIIHDFSELNLFIYKTENNIWIVSEENTGLKISGFNEKNMKNTLESSIFELNNIINRKGRNEILNLIKENTINNQQIEDNKTTQILEVNPEQNNTTIEQQIQNIEKDENNINENKEIINNQQLNSNEQSNIDLNDIVKDAHKNC